MRTAFIGGLLVTGSCLLLVVSAAIGAGGGSVSVRGAGAGSATLTIALVLLAAGSGLLAVGGPRPFDGRFTRGGLMLLGIGLAGVLATATVPADDGLVYVFLCGGVAAGLGILVTALGLLRAAALPRLAGRVSRERRVSR